MNYRYDVSIIIVNYNGKKYLDTLFDSLGNLPKSPVSFEVVFVDNKSSDDSVKVAEQYKDRIGNLKIVASGDNRGFAGGNNLGASHAEGEYLVFLNNDTRVDENWLYELYSGCKKESVGIASSKLLFFHDYVKIETRTIDKFMMGSRLKINGKDVDIDPKFCRNLLYEKNQMVCFGHSSFYVPLIDGIVDYNIEIDILNSTGVDKIVVEGNEKEVHNPGKIRINIDRNSVVQYKKTLIQNAGSGIDDNYNGYDIGFCEEDSGQYDEPVKLNNACGASMMIRKSDFERAGGFDEYFFMYYEDTDLSYKVKELGMDIYYVPTSIVRHIHTGSSKEWSPFFIYHVFRNRLLFILRHYPVRVFIKQFAKYSFSVARSILGNDQREVKKAKLRALLAVVMKIPQYYVKKRKKIQLRRRMQDK
jgi:GT2 family glycosyltransferase